MSTLAVRPEELAARADALARSSALLAEAGPLLSALLADVAAAAPAEAALAAQRAARRWTDALGELAGQGERLAAALRGAADGYVAVDARVAAAGRPR
jgi:uncharacterized protein YukE